MRKELSPSLKSFALQVALQLPDDQREAISVLQYAREIVARRTRPHPRTSGKGAADRGEYRQAAGAANKAVGMYDEAGVTF